MSALLIGVFIYWGWERRQPDRGDEAARVAHPGWRHVVSTVILLVTYVGGHHRGGRIRRARDASEYDDDDELSSPRRGADVLGSPWDKLVILAILTSAIASTQTTIIPASRTSFSMARQSGAAHACSRAIHPRFHTPWFSTAVDRRSSRSSGTCRSTRCHENFLFDTLSALSLMIAFYYALTGIACVIFYRRELSESSVEELPLHRRRSGRRSGDSRLPVREVRAIDLSDAENSYSGQTWLGRRAAAGDRDRDLPRRDRR